MGNIYIYVLDFSLLPLMLTIQRKIKENEQFKFSTLIFQSSDFREVFWYIQKLIYKKKHNWI